MPIRMFKLTKFNQFTIMINKKIAQYAHKIICNYISFVRSLKYHTVYLPG